MKKIENYYEHLMSRAIRLESGCLVLPNHVKHPQRYATARIEGTVKKAHRFIYETHNGSTDLYVCHTCDYPPCFELTHLFAGLQSDNMLDMYSKKRRDPKAPRIIPEGFSVGESNGNWKGGISANKAEYHRAWRKARKEKKNA